MSIDRYFIALTTNPADPLSQTGFQTGEKLNPTPGFTYGVKVVGSVAGVDGSGPHIGVAGSGPNIGVAGNGAHVGVSAFSQGGTAVQADTYTGTAIKATTGLNVPSNGTAIVAQANGANSTASAAQANGANSTASVAEANGANSTGVFVRTIGHDSVSLFVENAPTADDIPRGQAAVFLGHVDIRGHLRVTGGTKSAAVPHPDGSYRQLYCMESPESWFEDFGTGELRDGQAEVQLDPDFAAVVHSDAYHVFLTPEGDSRGLYVTNKRPTGFEVREQQGGASSLTFSYRVVAKRKDIDGPRLETVTHPGRRERPAMPEWSKAPDV